MRDPAEIYTKRGTPLVVVITRWLFAAYFLFSIYATEAKIFPDSTTLSYYWLAYLIVMYVFVERLYMFFAKQNIDMSFGFPLLFAGYVLNLVSMLLNGQDRIPLMNRAEHFLSFIILTYFLWIFFLKYLPQDVWRQHPYYTALIVLAFASTFGVVNEIVELTFDSFFHTNFIGAKTDTALDLLMNTLGATLFLSVWLILTTVEEPQ